MRAWSLLAALALAGCAASPVEGGLPNSIAVLGDSISRATNVKGDDFGEFPAHSWATGADPVDGVDSHLERLRALAPALDVVPFNDARSGARIGDLARQATEAERQGARYVVVLIGANDACASPPTDIARFREALVSAAATLGRMDAKVYVASVPDVTQLARLYGDNDTARAVWDAFDVCPTILAPDADLDAARRVIVSYNDALREEADARGWHWDGNAVFETTYERGHVSEVDFFHPSLEGQARLARVTWDAGPFGEHAIA